MTIESEAVTLLRSATVQRIQFSFATAAGQTISVNGSTFERVARAIDTGAIQIIDMSAFPRRIAGAYGGRVNQLALRHLRGRRDHGTLVHESVHASLDLSTGGRSITRADGECAAYIAEHVYFWYTGFVMTTARPIHAQAHLVASGVVRNRTVSPESLAQLRALIRRHPVYAATASSTPVSDG